VSNDDDPWYRWLIDYHGATLLAPVNGTAETRVYTVRLTAAGSLGREPIEELCVVLYDKTLPHPETCQNGEAVLDVSPESALVRRHGVGELQALHGGGTYLLPGKVDARNGDGIDLHTTFKRALRQTFRARSLHSAWTGAASFSQSAAGVVVLCDDALDLCIGGERAWSTKSEELHLRLNASDERSAPAAAHRPRDTALWRSQETHATGSVAKPADGLKPNNENTASPTSNKEAMRAAWMSHVLHYPNTAVIVRTVPSSPASTTAQTGGGGGAAAAINANEHGPTSLLFIGHEMLLHAAYAYTYNLATREMTVVWASASSTSLSAWALTGIIIVAVFAMRRVGFHTSDETTVRVGWHSSDRGDDLDLLVLHCTPRHYLRLAGTRPIYEIGRLYLVVDVFLFGFMLAAFITAAVDGVLIGPSVDGASILPVQVIFYVLLAVYTLVRFVLQLRQVRHSWSSERETLSTPLALWSRQTPSVIAQALAWWQWTLDSTILGAILPFWRTRQPTTRPPGDTTRAGSAALTWPSVGEDYLTNNVIVRHAGYIIAAAAIVLFAEWNLADMFNAVVITLVLSLLSSYLLLAGLQQLAVAALTLRVSVSLEPVYWLYTVGLTCAAAVFWVFVQLNVVQPTCIAAAAGMYTTSSIVAMTWGIWILLLAIAFMYQMRSLTKLPSTSARLKQETASSTAVSASVSQRLHQS
jgi:hypothetical protein